MSIINSYDNESEEIIKAKDFSAGYKPLPDTAIVTFKQDLIDEIKKDSRFEKYDYIIEGGPIDIYKTNYCGKEVALYRTVIGAPITVGMIEEIAARGVKNFIFFGTCGTLDRDIEPDKLIIPTSAYRDEGTSYHYLPASDYIEVETAEKLAKILEKKKVPYVTTKTWTTDGFYRETRNNMEKRKKDGCKVVEMECSAIMAACKVRGLNAYQFFYSADSLDGEAWDMRTLMDEKRSVVSMCMELALEIAKEL